MPLLSVLGIQDARVNTEAELESLLNTVYGAMDSRSTKLIYWAGFPAGETGHGWFGILSRSSGSNGSLVAWSAYDYGRLIRKVWFGGKWQTVEYYATATDLTKKVEMDVVWENSSLTSSFDGQTINLSVDLSAYDYIGILSVYDINGRRRLPMLMCNCPSDTGGTLYGGSAKDGYVVSRSVSNITATSVNFSGAYLSKNGAAGTENSNKYCVPYKIIGFKGVKG